SPPPANAGPAAGATKFSRMRRAATWRCARPSAALLCTAPFSLDFALAAPICAVQQVRASCPVAGSEEPMAESADKAADSAEKAYAAAAVEAPPVTPEAAKPEPV